MNIKKQSVGGVGIVLFLLMLAGMPHCALAALYNASGLLGTYKNNVPVYTEGSPNGGANPVGLYYPGAVAIDSINHRLFISDSSNNRILVFTLDTNDNTATTTPSYVLGQPDFTSASRATTQSGLFNPGGIDYDPNDERLFVTDIGNNRVIVFNVATSTITNGEDASYVLGQPNFTSSAAATTQNTLSLVEIFNNNPNYIAGLRYDPVSSRLFVNDANNNRVMVFNVSTSTIANGENASYVIGQPDFTRSNLALTQAGFSQQEGHSIGYDSAGSRLFVSDGCRVLIFNVATSTIANGEDASNVLGQSNYTSNGAATSQSGFDHPGGFAYDASTTRLFVSDGDNNRIMVFDVATSTITNGENALNVLGPSNFTTNPGWLTTQSEFNFGLGDNDLAYDALNGHLFVADASNNRVMIFNVATSTITNGENAIGLIGEYDTNNVPLYTKNSGNNGPFATGMFTPYFSALDSVGHRLFVSDSGNNRILVFALDGNNKLTTNTAAYVLGQPNFTSNIAVTARNGLNYPVGVAYDPIGSRLFVAEYGNNRVLIFNVATSTITNGEDASYVLGQPDFTSNTITTTQNGLNAPYGGLAYDQATNRLFVPDSMNNRVLIFNVATSTITNGEDASYVLGQPDFTSNTITTTQNGLNAPYGGLAYDQATNRLFVPDSMNNRVLIFNVATSTITNGEDASYVLGQSDFMSNMATTTQSGLQYSSSLAYNPTADRLFVGDSNNNRVLIFNVATSTIANGEDAESMIGQSDYSGSTGITTQSGFDYFNGLTYNPDNHQLFVDDSYNNRVLQFNFITITTPSLSDAIVNSTYTKTINTTSSQGIVSFALYSGSLPPGISLATSTGVISGAPTTTGTYAFTIEADDNFSTGPFFDRESYTLAVDPVPTPVPVSSLPSIVTVGGGGSAYDLTIDNGASSTPTQSVTLSLYGTEAYTMEISNISDFSSSTWIPYVTSLPWTLASSTGEQTVYIQYRAIGGTIVGSAEASIDLTTPSSVPPPIATTSPVGMSTSETQTLLASLELELQTLEAQASSTNSFFVFTKNLMIGTQGNDVMQLQRFLIANDSGPAAEKLKAHGATTFFGPLTKAALVEFQKKTNISPASGYFGPITRAWVNGM